MFEFNVIDDDSEFDVSVVIRYEPDSKVTEFNWLYPYTVARKQVVTKSPVFCLMTIRVSRELSPCTEAQN